MTPWRKALYSKLSTITVSGKVIDLGGSKKSGYHELLRGEHMFEVVNIDGATETDLNFNLEEIFPLNDASYDTALALNVLEHVFNYAGLLSESRRVLRSGGALVIAVPFLIPVHPSPHDHWRFTAETLEQIIKDAGFSTIEITTIGTGPGAVLVQMLGGMRGGVYVQLLFRPLGWFLDGIAHLFMSRDVLRERFPLGYVVVAVK